MFRVGVDIVELERIERAVEGPETTVLAENIHHCDTNSNAFLSQVNNFPKAAAGSVRCVYYAPNSARIPVDQSC